MSLLIFDLLLLMKILFSPQFLFAAQSFVPEAGCCAAAALQSRLRVLNTLPVLCRSNIQKVKKGKNSGKSYYYDGWMNIHYLPSCPTTRWDLEYQPPRVLRIRLCKETRHLNIVLGSNRIPPE